MIGSVNRTRTLMAAVCLLALPQTLVAQQQRLELIGLNVAGAEFGGRAIPGTEGTNFFFPKPGYFQPWAERGIQLIRFPVKWERLQPALNGELDERYAGLIDGMLADADGSGMKIILDIHNYARYHGKVIGSAEVPVSAYQDLMTRVAARWKTAPALYAYDLMNEPFGEADKHWPDVAQAGIDGVRSEDSQRPLIVEGRTYASSWRWPKLNDPLLALKDPADNLIFSAHMYLDKNASGKYAEKLGEDPDPMIGVKRLQPYIDWLKQHGKRGYVGELGIPHDEPRWQPVLDRTFAYLQENCVPVTYWAAGRHWGKDKLSVEDKNGKVRDQWPVLEKYIGEGNCQGFGPKS